MYRLSKKELKELFYQNKNIVLVEEDCHEFITNGKAINLVAWFKKDLNKKTYLKIVQKVNENRNYLNLKKWNKLSFEEMILNLIISMTKNSNIAGITGGLPVKEKGSPLIITFFN